uniref:Pentatricopeptide repeat-containing protein n=1 Tax=Salix viminalis TaxID=40686 RepID=A0A6N2LP83_SALVM
MFGKSFDIFMHVCVKGILFHQMWLLLVVGVLWLIHISEELWISFRTGVRSKWVFGFHKALIEGGLAQNQNVVTFSTLIDAYCKERNLEKHLCFLMLWQGNGRRLEDGHRLLLVALDKRSHCWIFQIRKCKDGLYLYKDMIKKRLNLIHCLQCSDKWSMQQGLVGDALRFFFQAMNRV